jgi:magnesium-transporting ATPase (P-type)
MLRPPQKRALLLQFLARFKNPLVIMLSVGPVSSVFDFLTFYIMLHAFHAGEQLFHTGWFIESMATQVPVIFIIRTRRDPFKSHPNLWLTLCSLSVVCLATALPFTPLGRYFGFVPPPLSFYAILVGLVFIYLFAVEGIKQCFSIDLQSPERIERRQSWHGAKHIFVNDD